MNRGYITNILLKQFIFQTDIDIINDAKYQYLPKWLVFRNQIQMHLYFNIKLKHNGV